MQAPDLPPEHLRAENESLHRPPASNDRPAPLRTDPPGFFDLSRDLLAVLDAEGTIHRTNPAFQEALAHAGDELTGQPLTAFVHPEDRPALEARWAALRERPQSTRIDLRLRHRNGSWAWLSWSFTPHDDGTWFYATATPLTDARQADAGQEILRVVSQLCLNSDGLAPIGRTIPRLIGVQLGFPVCLLERYDAGTGTLHLLGAHGVDAADLPPCAAEACVTGQTARTGRRLVLPGPQDAAPTHHPALGDRPLQTLISLPIKAGDEILGVLTLADERSRPASESLLSTLQLIAGTVAQQMKLEATRRELSTTGTYLRTLLASRSRAVFLLDPEGRIETLNAAAETLAAQHFGHTPEPGTLLEAALPEALRDPVRRYIDQALGGETSHAVHTIDAGELTVWLDATYAPIHDGTAVRGVHLSLCDVTEQRRSEDALQQREAQYRTLLDHVTELVALLDDDGRIRYANPAMERRLGYALPDLVGRPFPELIHPDDLATDPMPPACRIRTADGRWVPLSVRWHDLRTHPHLRGRLMTAQPVGDRAEIEARLHLYERILHASPTGIAVADARQPDLPLIFVNQGFEALTGYRAEEILGRNCRFLQGSDRDQDGLDTVRQAIRQGRPCTVELRNVRKDGTPFWNRLTLAPVTDPAGQITHFVGLQHDVTETRRLEREREHAVRRLEAILTALPDTVVQVNRDGLITAFHGGRQDDLPAPADGFVGRHLLELWPPPQGTRLMQRIQQTLDARHAGHVDQVEYTLPGPDGPRHFEARLVRADDDEVVVSIRDITERKRAEAELRQSSSRLREAQHLAHIGDWGLDVETGALTWSDEVFHLFERSPEAGPPPLDEALACLPPDDRARLDQARSRAIQTGRAYALDLCLELPSGTRRYVHERGRGVRNEAGQVVRLIGTILDITERKQAELALQASEERFRLLAENMQEFVCLHEPDGTYVWVSPSVKDLLGYEPDELIGQNPYAYFHPDDVEHIREHAHRPVLGEAPMEGVTVRYRFRHRDGSYVWLETLTRAILNDEGDIVRLQTSSRDVSSKVAAEEALEAERNLLRTLIDTLPDSIFIKDVVGRYVLCNTAHLRRLGAASLEDVIGRTVLDFYPESVAQTYYEEDLELIRTGASIIDHTHQGLDEQGNLSRWMRVTQVPLRNPSGEIVGLVGVARDVTEEHDRQEALKRYAEDLEQAKQVHEAQANELARVVEELEEARRTAEEARRTAEEATRVKSDFLAMMSHEIRTPMSGVIGMTELLLDTALDAEQQELVHVIRSSGETLLTILNDILDFSKIEAGRIELETHPFDLHTLLEDALQLIAGKAADRDVELVCRIPGDVPRYVAGDPTRVQQIVNNLLSNAVKFTEAGEVVLTAGATPLEDGRVELHLSVRDTGIGMAPEALDRLFEPFSQAQASTTRRYGGTGLGLAICRRLSTLMDGRIWAESEEGVGSTFHVTLRLTPTEPPAEASPEPTEVLQGRHLLIVDDHAVSREVLAELAASWGMQVQAVDSGIAALRWLNDAPACDAVLIDRHMPRMDGLMLARAMAPQHPGLPLILMHPFGRRENDPRLTDQLSKPIRRAALARTLAAALSRSPTPGPGESAPTPRTGRPRPPNRHPAPPPPPRRLPPRRLPPPRGRPPPRPPRRSTPRSASWWPRTTASTSRWPCACWRSWERRPTSPPMAARPSRPCSSRPTTWF